MFTTPQDFYNLTQDYIKFFPKDEKEIKEITEKVKAVCLTEVKKVVEITGIYQKASTGGASLNEIVTANKKAQDLLVTARFATFLAIPGSFMMVPALSKVAKEYDIPFVPESVAKEFDL